MKLFLESGAISVVLFLILAIIGMISAVEKMKKEAKNPDTKIKSGIDKMFFVVNEVRKSIKDNGDNKSNEEIEEEETSYTLTQLAQPKANHTYAYRVYGQRMYNNKKVVSAPSDYVTVDFSAGINKTEAEENAAEVARYTVDGVKVGANARGVVLVKYADGSVKKQIK